MTHEQQPRHPEWPEMELPRFSEHYTELVNRPYKLDDEKPLRTTIGPSSARLCIFCGRADSNASFSHDSHIIPAACANRQYFSNEECDDCNDKNGKNCENELASMLLMSSATFGIRGRSGRPKLKPPGSQASIGGSKRANEIIISTVAGDSAVSIHIDPAVKQFEVSALAPAYRPVPAVRSLLRSLWMFLSDSQRKKHQIVLEQATSESTTYPFVFLRGHIPGADPRSAELIAWEKTSDVNGPDVVLSFRLGHSLIVWTAPGSDGSYRGALLPPVASTVDAPAPTMTLISVQDCDAKIPSRTESIQFSFSKITKGTTSSPKLETQPKVKTSFEASLTLSGRGRNISFDNVFLRLRDSDKTSVTYTITGPSLGAELKVWHTNPPSAHSVSFKMKKLSRLSLADVQRTFELLVGLGYASCDMKIVVKERSQEILLKGPESDIDVGLGSQVQFVRNLAIINAELNTDFRFPDSYGEADFYLAEWIAHGIESGTFKVPCSEEVLLLLTKATGPTVLDCIRAGESFQRAAVPGEFELLGTKLAVGPISLGYLNPTTDEDLDLVEKQISSLGPGEVLSLRVRASHELYVFQRWTKPIAKTLG